MAEEPQDPGIQAIEQAIEQIGEHFDTVQIFATRHIPDGNSSETRGYTYGSGDWFSRYGQIQQWITAQDEEVRASARRKHG